MKIGDYELVMTCGACPEQYNVLRFGEQVGYLRLRHGFFRVDVPGCGGETIHTAHTKGDGLFEYDERMMHLNAAVAAIEAHRTSNKLLDASGPKGP